MYIYVNVKSSKHNKLSTVVDKERREREEVWVFPGGVAYVAAGVSPAPTPVLSGESGVRRHFPSRSCEIRWAGWLVALNFALKSTR